MTLENIVKEYITTSAAYKEFLSSQLSMINVDGLDQYPLSRAAKLIADKRGGHTFVILPTEDIAKDTYENLKDVNDIPIIYIPTNGKLLYSDSATSSGEYERKSALDELLNHKRALVILSLRSLIAPMIAPTALAKLSLKLKKGDRFAPIAFAEELTASGYNRCPTTYKAGDFSIRGEVMDIFPFSFKRPVRIYGEWSEIERIAEFDIANQKSDKELSSVSIPLLSDKTDDSLALATFSSFRAKDDYFIFAGIERLETTYESLKKEARALYNEEYKRNERAVMPDTLLFDYEAFFSSLKSGFFIYDIQRPTNFHYSVTASRSYFGNVTYFKDDISTLLRNDWNIFVLGPSQVQVERLRNVLQSFKIDIRVGNISSGFEIEEIRLLVVLDQEIFGRRKNRSKTSLETVSSPLDSFVELKEGDYVVHINYGIGQFEKIERIKTSNTERDYIKIRYDKGEYLYVPIEQANFIQKFIGNEGRPPKVDKIGSVNWSKKKERAMQNAAELASQLVTLYAERELSKGTAFSKDNDWQLQFEASFPHTETPDQLKCIEEMKKDMESTKVMDRLICGDVGFGKTEIAFRAAFKAVMSGKQVAFLAPTVILAEQHYKNFVERLGSFPVRAGILTRFVQAKEQRRTLDGLEEGSVDVVFGTHKLLNSSIRFKDLGLLIVDEEQRFGVKDKEKIKRLKSSIDCLTLSATPIPRTLYMSMLKVRDMSLLTTAPRERQPVETYIEEYNLSVVTRAIRRELERGGQVFYLHNRIEDLEDVASILRSEIPEAIIEEAHGRMDGEVLEDKMHRFICEGIQVLVSTTIIENGINIPNVNTIIIDRADRLGLSQLYQLRGRVGRSDRNAYCYLLYPDKTELNDDAIKRLRVLSENTELGSGFKIAMKDMEIRGAGNIIGREQSGHLEAVGLEMYMKLLQEEIDRLTQSGKEIERDVVLELDYSGFIPDSYIAEPTIKFETYKKIASIRTEGELNGTRSELENRFGTLPEEVDNLFCIAEIKIICKKLNIFHLKEARGVMEVEFSRVKDVNPEKVIQLVKLSDGRVRLDPKRINILKMETKAVSLRDKAVFILEQLRRLE